MAVRHEGLPGDVGADGGDLVAVVVYRVFAARLDTAGVVDDFGEIITSLMGYGSDKEVALFRGVEIVFRMVSQRESGARGCATRGALPGVLLEAGVDGLSLVAEHAFAVGVVLPRVLAGVMPGRGLGNAAAVDGTEGTLRPTGEAAVVPAAGIRFDGIELPQAVPLV